MPYNIFVLSISFVNFQAVTTEPYSDYRITILKQVLIKFVQWNFEIKK